MPTANASNIPLGCATAAANWIYWKRNKQVHETNSHMYTWICLCMWGTPEKSDQKRGSERKCPTKCWQWTGVYSKANWQRQNAIYLNIVNNKNGPNQPAIIPAITHAKAFFLAAASSAAFVSGASAAVAATFPASVFAALNAGPLDGRTRPGTIASLEEPNQ